LNPDEVEFVSRMALHLETKRNGFLYTGHEVIEGPGLRMASRQSRNRGYEVSLGVTLNYDIELAGHRRLRVELNVWRDV